jgi:hypothetical protein
MVHCRFGYEGGCKLNRHRASFSDLVYFHNNECHSQLENCLYAEKYPGLKRLVAEEFAGDVKRIINSFLPRGEHQNACLSELGKVFKECIDSNCERYRIMDFQIKIYDALEKAITNGPEYDLGEELCSTALKWVRVFQRFH